MAYVFVQEGGSSGEYYLKVYDTKKDASKGQRGCAKAAYRTTDTVEMSDDTNWTELDNMIQAFGEMF
jgi:hypothetical protein